MSRTVLATSAGLIGAALLVPLPAAAQSLPEPALEAQPVDADQWQRQIARNIPGYVSFEGLPAMRFGLLVTSTGAVRSCMALPVTEDQQARGVARGHALCESFVEHARFEPALDADGQPIDSVFIAHFGATRPIVAAHYAGEPVS